MKHGIQAGTSPDWTAKEELSRMNGAAVVEGLVQMELIIVGSLVRSRTTPR